MQTTNRKEKTTIKVICQSVVVVDMIMNATEPSAQHGLWDSIWEGSLHQRQSNASAERNSATDRRANNKPTDNRHFS